MAEVALRTPAGASTGTVALHEDVFGIQPNVPVMHQVVTAQLAKRRAGTQSTKTRAEVRGGGRKPYKQKGTGNARAGTTRAPHWSGGGVALGPKPRKYDQRTPKKMIRLALRSALSDRAATGNIVVVDGWSWDAPKTKDAAAAITALGLEGRVLVVLRREDEVAAKAFRNLPDVHVLDVAELNAYDVLCSEWIVFTQDTLPGAPADQQSSSDEQESSSAEHESPSAEPESAAAEPESPSDEAEGPSDEPESTQEVEA